MDFTVLLIGSSHRDTLFRGHGGRNTIFVLKAMLHGRGIAFFEPFTSHSYTRR